VSTGPACQCQEQKKTEKKKEKEKEIRKERTEKASDKVLLHHLFAHLTNNFTNRLAVRTPMFGRDEQRDLGDLTFNADIGLNASLFSFRRLFIT
jgi:hypothetical protein